MNENSKNRASLSPEEKRALLAQLLQEEADKSKTFPMSFAQQRLWFLHQLEPDSPVYNISSAIRLSGQLDVAALRQSLNAVIHRHEVLRTTFDTVDEQPVQVVSPALTLPLPLVNLEERPESKREAEAQQLIREKVRQPFDLVSGPLLNAVLLRLDREEHILLVIVHHIVFDGWSKSIFSQELFMLYESFSTGTPSRLPELPIQYADFACWQRQWLPGEVLESQLVYWEQQLAGAPPVLELPTDRPRPPVQISRGDTESFQLDADLGQKLRALSQQSGTTLFMTLMAAFAVLLARYSGQEDIVIGAPIANRNRREIEPLIGFFVNTLVLRLDLSDNPTFRELLARVRRVALGAYAHQDIPFEKLVDRLQPERNLSHTPLFQVMFVLQNAQNQPLAALAWPGLTLSSVEVESGTAKFDLTLSLAETEKGLTGKLEYNTGLFDATTITRMAGHFQTLLAGLVAHPEQCLSELPLLTEAERRQLLVEWNNATTDYPSDQCIHRFFEAQVEQISNATAVVFEDKRLTYGELNRRANQLAHYLQTLGVKPDTLVGICVERSLEMMVAVLGILKAGGAYVPLDPNHPPERLSFMLRDADISILLTQEHLRAQLPTQGTKTIALDTAWPVITRYEQTNPSSRVNSNHLVYVTYTSGSTGQAKGVMINHNSLVNTYFAWQEAYHLQTATKSHLQMANFSFDVFAGDWVRALCSGGKLVLCPWEFLLVPEKLYQLMRQERVDGAEFVPAVMRNLIQHIEDTGQSLDFMRILIIASDNWYASEYKKFQHFCGPNTQLINSYGVTEATIDSSYFVGDVTNIADDRLVPIGRPFANTQLYILDTHLQPVPVGVPGELYIGGAGLARGYLNRPKVTDEKFIPNPFAFTRTENVDERLYKTGDLARYLPDGNIEFLGRLDHQVKIRGFRIELAEIEVVLSAHPAVREVVVIVQDAERVPGNRAASSRDRRLVAYFVVAAQKPPPTPGELRNFLEEKLPDYMIPSDFVRLEAIPLTSNGKVNRRALPALETTRPDLEETYLAPRNHIEEVLVGIWAEVLGLDRAGVHDNFFELGGHSLQAVQLVSKMAAALSRDLCVKDIFLHPTIATFTDALAVCRRSNFPSQGE